MNQKKTEADSSANLTGKLAPVMNTIELANRLWEQGNQYFQMGEYQLAHASYQQALHHFSGNAPLNFHMDLGYCLYRLNYLAQAMSVFNCVIDEEPENINAHNNRGVILNKQGKPEEALVANQTVIKINPDDAIAYKNMAVILMEQKQLDAALDAVQTAIKIEPSNVSFHYVKGLILERQSELESAKRSFEMVLLLSTDETSRSKTQTKIAQIERALSKRQSIEAALLLGANNNEKKRSWDKAGVDDSSTNNKTSCKFFESPHTPPVSEKPAGMKKSKQTADFVPKI